MRMRPIHGVVVATAVGAAAAFGASAVKNTTHLGAAAQAQSGQKVDGIVRARSRKLDAEETALRKARRYHTPKLPSVPAAPHSIPSYAYASAPQPVAVPPPPPSAKAAPVRHLTLTRVVHRHVHHKPASEPRTTSTETTPTTTTTEETQPTPTTVTTTSQPPVTKTTSSTTSSQEPGDDSGHNDSHDDGGSGGDS
ncbi:MAG: hypothetical protein ACXVY8_00620 [Gaiellaceae bacterium]